MLSVVTFFNSIVIPLAEVLVTARQSSSCTPSSSDLPLLMRAAWLGQRAGVLAVHHNGRRVRLS